MNLQLKTVLGELIFEGDFSCVADLVRAALAAKKSLSYANLRYANLRYANLRSADLSSADLRYANLRSANLRSADLSSADLSYADLRYANLRSADLSSANLRSAKNSEMAVAMTRILPEGNIVGYKKCLGDVIVKLLIPTEAARSHAFGRKCRAEYATVLEIFGADHAISRHDEKTRYEVGKTVHCDKWSTEWTEECAGGIHFFITRLEAEAY